MDQHHLGSNVFGALIAARILVYPLLVILVFVGATVMDQHHLHEFMEMDVKVYTFGFTSITLRYSIQDVDKLNIYVFF